jgi:hypothetical protein
VARELLKVRLLGHQRLDDVTQSDDGHADEHQLGLDDELGLEGGYLAPRLRNRDRGAPRGDVPPGKRPMTRVEMRLMNVT